MSNTSIGSFITAHLFSNLKLETFLLNFNDNSACLLFLEALLVPVPEAVRCIFFPFSPPPLYFPILMAMWSFSGIAAINYRWLLFLFVLLLVRLLISLHGWRFVRIHEV